VSAPGAGILLALSGDDADILRVLSQAGSGLCIVRRCADLPELLSAGMAELASFALLDTGFGLDGQQRLRITKTSHGRTDALANPNRFLLTVHRHPETNHAARSKSGVLDI